MRPHQILAIAAFAATACSAHAFFWFTGGPVKDIGKDNIYPSLKADHRNIENALGQILLEQKQIKDCIAAIQKAFGGKTSVTLSASDRIKKNEEDAKVSQALMAQLITLKQKDPSNAAGIAVLERQVKNLEALRVYDDRLATLNAKSQQPMSFVERLGLQQELNVLNSQIFATQATNRATIEADKAAAEAHKTDLREMQQIRNSIRDNLGSK